MPARQKNDEGRVFPMTSELRTLMKEQERTRDELKARCVICPMVFQRNGAAIKTFIRAWREACGKAGCPGRLQHDLRRTAVRNFVRAGVPERVAMKLTGHKTRALFERYKIVSDSDIPTAASLLNEDWLKH